MACFFNGFKEAGMLETLRQGAQSWYFKGLLLILVASFAIWGVGDIFRGRGIGNSIMSVGSHEISATELSRTFQRRINQLSRQLGTELSIEQARQLGVLDQTVEAVAVSSLYAAEAENLGVTTSEADVAKVIREDPGFRNAQGKFDRAVFEQVIASNNLTEQGAVAAIRKQFNQNQILRSIAGDVPTSRLLADRLFQWRQERRVASYVTLRSDPTAEIAAPEDAVLQAYHKDHPALFTAPAYRKVTFLQLTPDDAKKSITISDEDLRTEYEHRLSEFSVPDRRTVQQMILPDEETAKKAQGLLAEGKDFVALAEEMAKQSPDVTNLGDVTNDNLPGTMSEEVFKLKKGETGAPVKGPFGWYLFRVTDVKPASTRPLKEVSKDLRDHLAADKAVEVIYQLSNALLDARAGGQTLEEAAAGIGLKTVTVDAVDRQGRAPDGNPVAAMPAGSTALQHAFATAAGTESGLLDTPEGGHLVIRVDSETPSALRPFDSVREQVLSAWKADQRRAAEEKKAETIVARLNEGALLSAMEAEHNLGEVADSPAFTRSAADSGSNFSRALVADMFAAKVGGAAYSDSPDGYTIAVLKEIRPADATADKKEYDAIVERLKEDTASDIVVQYAGALREAYSVKINQAAIDALFVQNN
jgi:peptidyl-prolyl cis-trans isomerase D